MMFWVGWRRELRSSLSTRLHLGLLMRQLRKRKQARAGDHPTRKLEEGMLCGMLMTVCIFVSWWGETGFPLRGLTLGTGC
ncbi:hypothetical protein BDZ91DRAFT_729492 [Kalaharituber pfeilii]|nr:hypothetical protein BDZ91DRAFT_729492 [Kalaharituber pfeilii]